MFWNKEKETYKKIEVGKPLQTIINKLKSIYFVARIDKVEELELLSNMGVTKHKSTEQYMHKFETTLVNGRYTFTICLMQAPQPSGCIDGTLYNAILIGVNYKTGEQFELQIFRDEIKVYGNMASIDVYNVIEQLYCVSLQVKAKLQVVREEQKVERNRLQKEKEIEELHSREKGSNLLLLYS